MSSIPLSDDLYDRAASKSSGRLKFKNATKAPREKERKRKERCLNSDDDSKNESCGPADEPVPQTQGAGRIVSSGPTVNGFESNFKEELQAGDTLLVHHPVSLKVEERVVEAVLSQRCLTIGLPFSRDLISTTEFYVRKDSITLRKLAEREIDEQKELAKKRQKNSSDSFNTESGDAVNDAKLLQDVVSQKLQHRIEKSKKKTITYRVKTGMWSYKTVTEEVAEEQEFGADAALDARAKKNRDKHCW